MNPLDRWKTVIIAALTVLTGVGMEFGLIFPEGFVLETSETLIALGAVFGALRHVTEGKVGYKK